MPSVQFGNYEVVRKIGTGGMAQVYEAYRIGLSGFSKRVALKCILPEHTREPKFVEMFINEARLGSQLHHPNIIEIQDFNKVGQLYYIAMEYIEGIDLGFLIDQFMYQQRLIPPNIVIDVTMSILEALKYAHTAKSQDGIPMDVIHRDIKPSNILITRQGQIKLADFGIAKAATNLYQTSTNADVIKGSISYMAPEQLTRESPVSPLSDLFSVGVVLYEMLAQMQLFTGDNVPGIMFNVVKTDIEYQLSLIDPIFEPFTYILRRALVRSPQDRYQDASEMIADLMPLRYHYPNSPALSDIAPEFVDLFVENSANNNEIESFSLIVSSYNDTSNISRTAISTASTRRLEAHEFNEQTNLNLNKINSNQYSKQLSSDEVSYPTKILPPVANPSDHNILQNNNVNFSTEHVNTNNGVNTNNSEKYSPSSKENNNKKSNIKAVSFLLLIAVLSVGIFFLLNKHMSNSVDNLPKNDSVKTVDVLVDSEPRDAEIWLKNEPYKIAINNELQPAKTPSIIKFSKEENTLVSIKKEGFKQFETQFSYNENLENKIYAKLLPLSGKLKINSDPSGATIEFNGKILEQKTPATIDFIKPKQQYSIKLMLEGYTSVNGSIDVVENETATFTSTLTKTNTKTSLEKQNSNENVGIVSIKKENIVLNKKNDTQNDQKNNIIQQSPTDSNLNKPNFEVVSEDAKGVLVVSTVPPDCTVFIDGISKGTTPLTIQLSAGGHVVKLEKFDGHIVKEFNVQIAPKRKITRVWDIEGNHFISE